MQLQDKVVRFLILLHPKVHDLTQTRASDPDVWLRRMRSLRGVVAAQHAPDSRSGLLQTHGLRRSAEAVASGLSTA